MTDPTPTKEDMEAGVEVVGAGQAAADAEPDPQKKRGAAARAIKKESASKGWELSDDDADKLAGAVVGKLGDLLSSLPGDVVEGIRTAGGFDNLPEPLAVPAAPSGGGSAPAEPPAAPAAAPDDAPGGHRTKGAGAFARWFRSGG